MALADRTEFHLRATTPATLADVVTDGMGLFFVHEGELLTGFQRQLYAAGFMAVELDGSGAIARVYQLAH